MENGILSPGAMATGFSRIVVQWIRSMRTIFRAVRSRLTVSNYSGRPMHKCGNKELAQCPAPAYKR